MDELEGPADAAGTGVGGDHDEEGPRDPVWQDHFGNAVVRAADVEHAIVLEESERRHEAGARRIGGEEDRVAPAARVRDPDPLVGHRPCNRQRSAAAAGRRGANRGDRQVRKGDPRDVEHVRSSRRVVGLRAVLEDDTRRVRADEEREPPLEGRRQQDASALDVALANRERAGVGERREDLIVAVAGDGVRRDDDRIDPRGGQTLAGPEVRDGPADGHAHRIPNGQRGSAHRRDGEVREGRLCDVDGGRREIVALA